MYQPVIPAGGVAGWRYLERTLDAQRDAYAEAGPSRRAMDYFREKIATVTTPEALVADRRLREVALAAFGLEADVDSVFFVRKLLEEGTRDPGALANRLSDARYRDFVAAFAFDDVVVANTQVPGFADRIAERFIAAKLDVRGEPATAETLPEGARNTLDAFRSRIASITTPEDLVADAQLFAVTLQAFDLNDHLSKPNTIRQVLAEGARDPDALARRIGDPRLVRLAEAFGFDREPSLPEGTAETVLASYEVRAFEAAVGGVDDTMRVALNGRRAMAALGEGAQSNDAKWFTIMGTPPLRKLMEGALGLPQSFGAMDIDRQLTEFERRAEATFGTADVGALAADPTLSRIIDLYLVRSAPAPGAGGATSPALQILRGF